MHVHDMIIMLNLLKYFSLFVYNHETRPILVGKGKPMVTKLQSEIEALWEGLQPQFAAAWQAYEQLNGVPASAWSEQERALFNLKPSLYRDYRSGLTPAMERGSARRVLTEQLSDYARRFGHPVLLADLEAYLNVQIRAAK